MADNKMKRAVRVDDIVVKMEDDNHDPYITGSVVVPGDKMVVVDSNNDSVKLIDLNSCKVLTKLEFDSKLWDITVVNDTHVAVTNPGDYSILFINLVSKNWSGTQTNKLALEYKVDVDDECQGIACLGDKFVVIYRKSTKVEIINRDGDLLQTLVTQDKGNELFTLPWYVVVSPDQQTIYISDTYRESVTSLDLSGQVKAIYKDDYDLSGPSGMAVDSAGLLYVCGGSSHNVYQLTPNLHKVQELIEETDAILKPESVSWNEEQMKLYVGMWNSDIIKVYQLQS